MKLVPLAKVLGLISLFFLVCSGYAAAADESGACKGWDGLWRIFPPPGEGDPAVHLEFLEKSGKCVCRTYGSAFGKPFDTPAKFDGSVVTVESLPLATTFVMTLERKGDVAEGKVELVHPQGRASYPRLGCRITTSSTWNPIAGVKARADEQGIIDLVDILSKGDQSKKPETFLAFWSKNIEADFYAVVEDLTYGTSGGTSERDAGVEKIRKLIASAEFQERAKKFSAEQREVVGKIKSQAPDLYFPNLFLLAPFSETSPIINFTFVDGFVTRIGIDSLPKGRSSFAPWIAEEHLKIPLYRIFPVVDRSLVARLCRDGMASYWAVTKGFAKDPLDCLIGGRPEGSLSFESPIPKGLKAKIARAIKSPPVARTVTDAEMILVGYDFAKRLSAVLSVPELLGLDRAKLAERLSSYLADPN